jgi:hypothetical protein
MPVPDCQRTQPVATSDGRSSKLARAHAAAEMLAKAEYVTVTFLAAVTGTQSRCPPACSVTLDG